jgi:hypothetical protein
MTMAIWIAACLVLPWATAGTAVLVHMVNSRLHGRPKDLSYYRWTGQQGAKFYMIGALILLVAGPSDWYWRVVILLTPPAIGLFVGLLGLGVASLWRLAHRAEG